MIIPVIRSPQDPAHTARGVANGVFWALTPTVGLQTAEILATWIVAKRVLGKESSIVQALVWVWINNPITMLPMYYAFYVTGLWLTGGDPLAQDYRSFSAASAMAVGVPLLIGCLPYACVGSFVSYRWAIRVLRRRRQRLASR